MQTDALLTERAKTHGRWEENARISQGLLRVLRTGSRWPELTDSQLEALQMISHKEHRIVNGDPNVPDHWDDIAGYATLEANRLHGIEVGSEPLIKCGFCQCGCATTDEFKVHLIIDHCFGPPPTRPTIGEIAEASALSEYTRSARDMLLSSSLGSRECQCENPIIKCDNRGCRCTSCGLPERHGPLVKVENPGLDLYTGPVQDFAASPPPWPNIARSVVGSLLGAETVYLPDRSRIDPEVVEELCRLDGKLPRLDYANLHPALQTLYTKQVDGDEFILLDEFMSWAS